MSVRNVLDGTIKVGGEIGRESELEVKKLVATDLLACPLDVRFGRIIAQEAELKGILTANGLCINNLTDTQHLEVSQETKLYGTLTLNDKPVLREFVETSNLVFTLTMQDNSTKTITQKSTYSLTSVGQCINMFGFYADLNTTGMGMPKKVTVTAPVPTYDNVWKAYNVVAIRTDGEGTLYQASCTTSSYKGKEGIDLELRFTQNTNVPFLVIKLDIPMH